MAGGESLLSVVIAHRMLFDFSENSSYRSLCDTGHGVPFGLAIPERLLSVPGSILFSMNPHTFPGLNYYRGVR